MGNRLTGRNEYGGIVSLVEGVDINVAYMRVVRALAAYEEADESGLLVRLPCKVGGAMWHIRTHNTRDGRSCNEYREKCECELVGYGHKKINYLILRHAGEQWTVNVNMCAIGKTVFLTREEAEAALAEREGVR